MDQTEKVNVTFTETRIVDDHRKGTSKEERFEAGKTYSLSARSADRWVKRGVANFTTAEDAAKATGASSDVSLNLQDAARSDPNASRVAAVGTGTATDTGADADDGADLSKKKLDELKTIAVERNVDITGLTAKADILKAIERDAEIKEALASGKFEDLTVAELQKVAADHEIDLTGKTAKPDVIEAVKAGYKPAAA